MGRIRSRESMDRRNAAKRAMRAEKRGENSGGRTNQRLVTALKRMPGCECKEEVA